jgi:hypothetical protein
MEPRRIDVKILKRDYSGVLSPLPLYETVSVTWQDLGIGTASLVAGEDTPLAEALNCMSQVVPVSIKAPGLPRWTGRVAAASSTKESGQAVGQVIATCVDDNKILDRILLAPVPTSPWSNQTAATHDTRTGKLVAVAKAHLTANIARLAAEGRPINLQVVPTTGVDNSPTVTMKARAISFDELYTGPLRTNGYDARVTLWLPGDPVPAGMDLLAPTWLVDIVQARDKQYVRFSDAMGGLRRRVATASHPDALATVVGGPGEGTARIFQKVVATDGRAAALGGWGYPELWHDATGADTSDDRIASGQESNLEGAGKSSLSFEIDDNAPWKAGPTSDYWIGDTTRVVFNGLSIADRIDRVTATDDPDGYRVTASFGSARDTESADVRLARTVRGLAQQLRALEAGR